LKREDQAIRSPRHSPDGYGQRTVTVRQHGRSGDADHKRGSENFSTTARPLLMPQEIMRLAQGKELVLVQGKTPILAERINYYDDHEFLGLFDPNPMISGN
jgi:type IV secretory pathway TraG/TraD family ATPase VirD4